MSSSKTTVLAPLMIITGLSMATLSPGDARTSEGNDHPAGNEMNDFSFLTGRWTIRHYRLKESMVDSDEWDVFDTEYEAWPVMNGAGSLDRVFGQVNGDDFEGVSVRTYDKESDEWTIYWMDTGNTTLREQVRGRFENGVGTFYGNEVYRGTTYRMRFLWKDMTETSARWEQAYQDPETDEWETNWVMEFQKMPTRLPAHQLSNH